MNQAKLVSLIMLVLLAVVGCGAEQEPEPAQRAELLGESTLIGHFREAEDAHGVPAELLATIAWLQSRLSQNLAATDSNDHGVREWGVMAIGTGGLTDLHQAADRIGLSADEVAADPRANVMAAAAILADEAARQGITPSRHADWAPVLSWYGGPDLAEGVLRLLKNGWNGWDDADAPVEVVGTGPDDEQPADELADGLGVVQQGLGYPGAKWSPAYGGNYSNASRGKSGIKYIVIHTIQGSYAGAISWFKNPSANVSAHYVVRSSDGAVTQMVDDRDIAWHDGCFNTYSIGIEHEGYVSQPKKWYTDEMYRSSAKLVSWLADKYNIPKDRKHIMGHGETPDCSDHYDPGSGWNWSKYMKLVKNGGKLKTLKAKVTRKWSNAKRYKGKKAHYQVCAGKPFKFAFTFRNKGNATWRDVKGRGKNIGNDVFLVTANGKKDKLTGKKRFSLKHNKNRVVRGDRKAKNCSNKNGCRKTMFIRKGIKAVAPKKPGIYKSRWRLRDYSRHWGKKSHGFGPKVELKFKVKKCAPPKDCSCTYTCGDGSKKTVKTTCSANGTPQCSGIQNPCSSGSGGTSSGGTSSGGTSSGGTSSGGTSSGSGGASGDTGASTGGSSGDTGGGSGPEDTADDDEDIPDDDLNGIDYDDSDDATDESLPEEDDPDFEEDGFNGDDEGSPTGGTAEAACSVSQAGGSAPAGTGLLLSALGALAWAGRRRRRRAA